MRMQERSAQRDGHYCHFCKERISGQDLDDPDAIYKEVTSWVTGPKLQSPTLREHTGRIAHATCVKKMLDGEAPDQVALPGLE